MPTPPLSTEDLLQRAEARIERITETGCWIWMTDLTKRGYGRWHNRTANTELAHRRVFELYCGPILAELELDHICRVLCCVNPAHLEPVPHIVNVQRGTAGHYNRIKTQCKNGHPYDAENTYQAPSGRGCRVCRSAAARRHVERNREASRARCRAYYRAKQARVA